jgi:CheY-like chemotaxis protein
MTRECTDFVMAAPPEPRKSPSQRPVEVLVVDDEADSLALMAAILEARGFSVACAASGADALRSVRRRAPDVILLDVMMPRMSGLDVLRCLREVPATARTPVILVTAKRQDEDLLVGYRLGADYYITKPCTSDQLIYGLGLVLSAGRGG